MLKKIIACLTTFILLTSCIKKEDSFTTVKAPFKDAGFTLGNINIPNGNFLIEKDQATLSCNSGYMIIEGFQGIASNFDSDGIYKITDVVGPSGAVSGLRITQTGNTNINSFGSPGIYTTQEFNKNALDVFCAPTLSYGLRVEGFST